MQIYHRQVTATTSGWNMPPVMLGEDGRFEFKAVRGTVEFMVMFAPAQGPNSPAALAAASAAPPPCEDTPPPARRVEATRHPATGARVVGGFVPGAAPRPKASAPPAGAPAAAAATSETHRTIAGVPIPVGWRVRALRLAGKDVTHRGVEVGQEGIVEGVEVEVAADEPFVTGLVRDELGHPYAGAWIVAIADAPRAARTPDARVRVRGLSIQNGRYFAGGLEPGTWDLVALANVADPALIDDDEEGIARLRRSATRVELSPSEMREVELRVVRLP